MLCTLQCQLLNYMQHDKTSFYWTVHFNSVCNLLIVIFKRLQLSPKLNYWNKGKRLHAIDVHVFKVRKNWPANKRITNFFTCFITHFAYPVYAHTLTLCVSIIMLTLPPSVTLLILLFVNSWITAHPYSLSHLSFIVLIKL